MPIVDGVYQFTNDAAIFTECDGLQWLGYEHVGENYEPGYFYSKEAEIIGCSRNLTNYLGEAKIVLDIGAGLGASAISFALAGLNVIAADISQAMLVSAVKRARMHKVPDEQIMFARMNGYKLALADNSVDAVLEVDMLQQVDRPELVVEEILRVLKPDGCFLQYGGWYYAPYSDEQQAVNETYNKILNDIQAYYKDALAKTGHIKSPFESWTQIDDILKSNFTLQTTLEDTGCYDSKDLVWTLAQGLHKTKTRAAGKAQLIPDETHNKAWNKTVEYAINKYGNDYESVYRYYNVRSGIEVYQRYEKA